MKLLATLTIAALSATTFADSFIVTANLSSWSPSVANVVPGDIIRFEYGKGYPHTITSGSSCMPDGVWFDEPLTTTGDYYEFTVPDDGTTEIPFYCAPHCASGMTGVIMIDVPEGHMRINMVNVSSPDLMLYDLDPATGTASISIENEGVLGSSFSIAVEVEEADVDVEFEVLGSENAHMLEVSTGIDSVIYNGTVTLEAWEQYVFHGDTRGAHQLTFKITWPEEGFETGPNMIGVNLEGIGTIDSFGDSFAMYCSNSDSAGSLVLNADVDGEIFLGNLGDVACSTLVLPPSGEEAKVLVSAGEHTISVGGVGLLWIPEEGGGAGGGVPEDVDGDGVVGVGDILAIIAAWGSTSP